MKANSTPPILRIFSNSGGVVGLSSGGEASPILVGCYHASPAAAEALRAGSRFELVNARENFDAMLAGGKTVSYPENLIEPPHVRTAST